MKTSLGVLVFVTVIGAWFLTEAAPGEGARMLESTRQDQQEVAVTIYNEDLGLVKDRRRVRLERGLFLMEFKDVASRLDPTSVYLKSLTHPGELFIREQNYEFDVITPGRLLEKSVGRKVVLVETREEDEGERRTEAVLISVNAGETYQIGDEIHLGHPGRVVLSELPPELRAQPTLVWLLENVGDREQTVEASYLTRGLSWRADYVGVLSADERFMGLTCWVTIQNESGGAYEDAQVKLIAGEIHRDRDVGRREAAMVMRAEPAAPQFEEQAFFEYHMYALNRPSTIKENQIKQLALHTVENVPLKKRFVYRGPGRFWGGKAPGPGTENPVVEAVFKNDVPSNLGIPLPQGAFRTYKPDADQALQFIGEDRIAHTPKDEEVTLRLGKAFDIVVERIQTDFRSRDKSFQESVEIQVRNRKSESVTVLLEETLRGDWQIIRESHTHTRKDAFTIAYQVDLAPGASDTVAYTVLSQQ